MKVTRLNSLIALMIVFLTLLSSPPTYAGAEEEKTILDKKELKALLKNARTPADQVRIAAYYRQKAQQLTASSKRHADLAATYAKNPPFAALEAKHGILFGQGDPHCRYWAKRDAEEATKADALAERHEEMAGTAAQKQAL